MNLAFRLFLLVFVFACLLPGAFSALSTVTKAVCNSGDANVVWSTGNTYFLNVDGNVDVENCQLTIQPGAIVKLKSNDINSTFLRVWNRGVLLAQGNDTNKVIFTSQNDDSVGTAATDSNGTPGSPDYNSAIFLSASAGTTPDANDFFDLNISYGRKAVQINKGINTIHDCNFQNNTNDIKTSDAMVKTGAALLIFAPVTEVYNNTFTNNTTVGSTSHRAPAFNNESTITNFYGNAVFGNTPGGTQPNVRSAGTIVNIYDNNITGNTGKGLLFTNTTDAVYNNVFASNTSSGLDGGTATNVYDNIFTGNGSSGANISATNVYNNLFSNNGTGLTVGTITNIYDNNFLNNSATYGGGIYVTTLATNIHNNLFSGNTADYGGAILSIAIISGDSTISSIYNNTFINNSATIGGGTIGAVTGFSGTATITSIYNNTFRNNNGGTLGGGIYSGISAGGTPSIGSVYNNVFFNNTATNGGGIEAGASTTITNIYNNIFAYNTGTAVRKSGTITNINNNVYWANDANVSGVTEGGATIFLGADPFANDTNGDRNFLLNSYGITQLLGAGDATIGTDSFFAARTARHDNQLDYNRSPGWHADQNAPYVSVVGPGVGSYTGTVSIDFNVSTSNDTAADITALALSYAATQTVGTSILSQALSSYTCTGSYPSVTKDINCSYSWDSSALSDGNYFLTAQATDANGTETVSLASSIILDNTSPSLSLTITGVNTTGNTAKITYSATGTSGIKKYWISTDSGTSWTDNGTNTDYNYTLPANAPLPYTVNVWIKAMNNADQNSSIQEARILFEAGSGTTTYCGDAKCNGQETPATCPTDCAPICGDQICTGNETITTCPQDCAIGCGDGFCAINENCTTCQTDCGACSFIPGTVVSEKTFSANPSEQEIIGALKASGLEHLSARALEIRENFDIRRTITVSMTENSDYVTTVTIMVQSIKNAELSGLSLLESIPKSFAQNAGEIETLSKIIVLEEDPVVEFVAGGKLGKTAFFSYSVPKDAGNSEFAFPIVLNMTLSTPVNCLTGCDDANPCTKDQCINNECVHFVLPNETTCGYAQKCSEGICIAFPVREYVSPVLIFGLPLEMLGIAVAVIIGLALAGIYYYKKQPNAV